MKIRYTVTIFIIYIALAMFYIFYNPVTPEEGNYLYGSVLALQGNIPLFDFQSDLSILWYYVYGLAQHLFGAGIYVGRFTSFSFNILTLFLVFKITRKMANTVAANIALSFMIINPTVIGLFTAVNTFSLNAFLLTLMMYILISEIKILYKYILTAFLAVLAASVSLINICLLILLFIAIIIVYRSNKRRQIASLLFIGIIISAYIYILRNLDGWGARVTTGIFPRVVYYNVLGTTASRLDFLNLTARKLTSYGIYIFSLLPVIYCWFKEKWEWADTAQTLALYFVSGSSVVILFAHLFQTPANVNYNVIITPYLSILFGLGFYYVFKFKIKSTDVERKLFGGIVATLVFLSFLQEEYIPLLGINIGKTAITEISEVAENIKTKTKKDNKILSFDAAVAVEAQRMLVGNTICGWKSFFPGVSDEQAARYHVINTKQLVQLIREKKPAIVFINDPRYFKVNTEQTRDIDVALVENYEPVARYQDFNNQGKAYLLVPRKNNDGSL